MANGTRNLAIMDEFKRWLKDKYGWSFDYFSRLLGDARKEAIWDEFYAERETKKHRE